MSLFTKRRKIVRQKQEEEHKRWSENNKKTKKSMNDILNVCSIIDEQHPEFDSLDGEERVKLFSKLFEEVHGTE